MSTYCLIMLVFVLIVFDHLLRSLKSVRHQKYHKTLMYGQDDGLYVELVARPICVLK